jgi:hypothetical protein
MQGLDAEVHDAVLARSKLSISPRLRLDCRKGADMSEALDHVRQACAEFDARNPHWRAVAEEDKTRQLERQKRELAEARKVREAHKAREAETVSANLYGAIDGRIHEHLANWLWNAIDARIRQWWEGEGELLKGGIGGALGSIRQQLRKEFRHGIEEAVDAVAAQLVEQKERFLAVPGRLPVAKIWRQESVVYGGELVSHDGSLWQARTDTAQAPGGSDWSAWRAVRMGKRRTPVGRLTRIKLTRAWTSSNTTTLLTSHAAIIQACVLVVAGKS